MVEFLKDVNGENFTYEAGKRYFSMDDLEENNLKDKVLVRQPNSPKKKNLWTQFSKSDEGVVFRTIDNCEMSLAEMIEENRVLQY